jgi:trans-aconitate methyltransferase
MLESLIRGHDLATSKKATKVLITLVKKYKPKGNNFYDLGCGHGTLSLQIKKKLPHLYIYAIDNSKLRIMLAKLRNKILRRNINFQKKDIFATDLSKAEIVYTYLWYDLMPILEKKLLAELPKGAVVITNTSHFHNWQAIEKVETNNKNFKIPNFESLFVYIKK